MGSWTCPVHSHSPLNAPNAGVQRFGRMEYDILAVNRSNAIYVGTYGEVRLKFPFCWMKKADIVALGLELGVPYELTYSCYAGNPFSCGQCPTCIERIEAFKSNSLIDPIEYEIGVEWEGCDEYYQK